jgi:hypothetical protein
MANRGQSPFACLDLSAGALRKESLIIYGADILHHELPSLNMFPEATWAVRYL